MHRTNRPWKRHRRRNNSPDPATVREELRRRKLRDIDDCRIAWEQGSDPLAVCVALTKAGLPEWLEAAALVLLTSSEIEGLEDFPRRMWRQRTRDATDAMRAEHFADTLAKLRPSDGTPPYATHAETLAVARKLFDKTSDEYSDLENVGDAALKRSYHAVLRGLSNDGRYFSAEKGFDQQYIFAALQKFLEMMRRQLESRKSGSASALKK